jgi:hypothetical protein
MQLSPSSEASSRTLNYKVSWWLPLGGIKPRPHAFKANTTATKAELAEEVAVWAYNEYGCPTFHRLIPLC